MLYPIELLGLMTGAGPDGVATDGVHVNGQGGFCHVVRQLFRRKPLSHPTGDKPLPTGLPSPSCKMHWHEMPSLHIAMSHTFEINLSYCFKRI